MWRLEPRRTSRHRAGQLGAATMWLESCCWPGMAWGHLGSPAWGLWCPRWHAHQMPWATYPSSCTQGCEGSTRPSSDRRWASQIPGWRGRHTAQLLPHTFPVLSATRTKLAGVYNPGSKAMKTRGQSPSSGAWPGVGLGPFTSNICDFCPGSYF